ncbi:hypothetical protein L6R53_33100, partial [Myxococcota bacterium]|nr:hypothetical protein [Myxococcota bacterium]
MTLAGLALLLPARAAPASGADGGADGATDAAPAAAIAEADLVRAALEGPALRGALQASRARGEAAGTGPALLSNPELLARHEQEGGSAGITTDALGAGLRVDLGLASVAERGAARLAGQAALARTRADTLEAICEVRAGALDLWLAGAQAEATGAASTRLEALARDMERLAAAGEISGYDRDRVTLARLALAAEHDARRVEQARARAALAAWTGAEVPAVDLL